MRKKGVAVLLALALAASALTGCGKSASEEGRADAPAAPAESAEQAPETKAEEQAEEKGDPASLRLVMYGEAGSRNTDFFKNEFHDRVMEELNLDVSIDYVPWGGNDQIATMCASGEKFAFMMTNTLATFPTWGQSGYFATFDREMIDRVAPAYLEARLGNNTFSAAKYNGEIVLIPVGGSVYSSMYDNFCIRNDILKEVGMDVSDIHTYDDLVAALEAVHEAKPEFALVKDVKHLIRGLDSVYGDGAIFDEASPTELAVVNLADDSDEVINWLESDYFADLCHLAEEWYEKGFITVEHVTDQSVYETAYNNGECLTGFGSTNVIYNHKVYTNGEEVEDGDMRYLKLDDNPYFITKDYDWAWAVSSADQDNVENYMRLFNWIYESEENYLFSLYGVEGTDYEFDEDGTIVRSTTDGLLYDWMFRTFYYEPISEEKFDAGEIAQYMDLDGGAIINKRTGFVFDNSAVTTEEALLTAIVQEKVKPIAYGISSYDDQFPAVLEELKAAGLDKYVEEYQRQFSEFMANK